MKTSLVREGEFVYTPAITLQVIEEGETTRVRCLDCGHEFAVEDLEQFVRVHMEEHSAFAEKVDKLVNTLYNLLLGSELNLDVEVRSGRGYIDIEVGTRIHEMGEYVSEKTNEYCEEEEISEEECEKIFEESYKMELEELNEEFVIRVRGKIDFPLFRVIIEPKELEGDNSIVGMRLVVEFKGQSIFSEKSPEEMAMFLFHLVELFYRNA